MKVGLVFREHVRKISSYLEEELDRLVAALQGWSARQHTVDGAHTAVTADSLTVAGAITLRAQNVTTAQAPFNANAVRWTIPTHASHRAYMETSYNTTIPRIFFDHAIEAAVVDPVLRMQWGVNTYTPLGLDVVMTMTTDQGVAGVVQWGVQAGTTQILAQADTSAYTQSIVLSGAKIATISGSEVQMPSTKGLAITNQARVRYYLSAATLVLVASTTADITWTADADRKRFAAANQTAVALPDDGTYLVVVTVNVQAGSAAFGVAIKKNSTTVATGDRVFDATYDVSCSVHALVTGTTADTVKVTVTNYDVTNRNMVGTISHSSFILIRVA